jgi:putative membrane protein
MPTALALLVRVIVIAVSLGVAAYLVPGIAIDTSSPGRGIGTLLAVALIFGIINAILKPIIKVVGCAFYVLTLGLIGLVVNALLFLLVGSIAGSLHLPFTVDGFGAAFLGAIVVSVVAFILHFVIPDRIDER